MRSIAIGLVIIGIAVLAYGVIGYSNNRHTIEVGSMSASVTESGTGPLTAIIVGGIALVGGVLLLSSQRRSV